MIINWFRCNMDNTKWGVNHHGCSIRKRVIARISKVHRVSHSLIWIIIRLFSPQTEWSIDWASSIDLIHLSSRKDLIDPNHGIEWIRIFRHWRMVLFVFGLIHPGRNWFCDAVNPDENWRSTAHPMMVVQEYQWNDSVWRRIELHCSAADVNVYCATYSMPFPRTC